MAGADARIEYYRSLYTYFLKHRGSSATNLLKFFVVIKLVVGLVANVLSCFYIFHRKGFSKYRRRISTYRRLLGWHLHGCPEGDGLRPSQ